MVSTSHLTLFEKLKFLRPQNVLKVCTFGPTLGPIYPMKNSEIAKSKYFKKKIYPSGYPNIQKFRLYPVSIFNEKYNYFLQYLVFFRTKKDPKLKDQKVRDQVSTTFSEAPQWDLTFGERISRVALVILALFQLYCRFFRIRTHFFDFGAVFGCHALSEKKNN